MADAIRVLVNGARGRMGSMAARHIGSAADLELCGCCDQGDDLGRVVHESRAQVVVDFTLPSVVCANVLQAIAAGARPVVGTSGLTVDDCQAIAEACREKGLGGLWAPNFALGAVLMMRFAAEAARHLPSAEIVEAHHPAKVDAPSGTAIRTAQMMAQARAANPRPDSPEANAPARGETHAGIQVHSLRLAGLIAEQEVQLGATGETLSIKHTTYSREAFMPGVLLACRRVVSLDRWVVGLEHVL